MGAITEEQLRRYIVALGERRADGTTLRPASLNNYVRAVRAFFKWAHLEGFTEIQLLARLRPPKIPYVLVEVLTEEAASQAKIIKRSNVAWSAELGSAKLAVEGVNLVAADALESPGYGAPFDVIASARIEVTMPRNAYDYEGRSHSLWYCNAADQGVFRWYETAFMFGVFSKLRSSVSPFFLEPGSDVGRAMTPIMGTKYQVAWPFAPFDQGDQEEFFERWIAWFAQACEGRLSCPSHMPERDPTESYRPPARRWTQTRDEIALQSGGSHVLTVATANSILCSIVREHGQAGLAQACVCLGSGHVAVGT